MGWRLIICETCIWPGFRNLLSVGFCRRITNYKLYSKKNGPLEFGSPQVRIELNITQESIKTELSYLKGRSILPFKSASKKHTPLCTYMESGNLWMCAAMRRTPPHALVARSEPKMLGWVSFDIRILGSANLLKRRRTSLIGHILEARRRIGRIFLV